MKLQFWSRRKYFKSTWPWHFGFDTFFFFSLFLLLLHAYSIVFNIYAIMFHLKKKTWKRFEVMLIVSQMSTMCYCVRRKTRRFMRLTISKNFCLEVSLNPSFEWQILTSFDVSVCWLAKFLLQNVWSYILKSYCRYLEFLTKIAKCV